MTDNRVLTDLLSQRLVLTMGNAQNLLSSCISFVSSFRRKHGVQHDLAFLFGPRCVSAEKQEGPDGQDLSWTIWIEQGTSIQESSLISSATVSISDILGHKHHVPNSVSDDERDVLREPTSRVSEFDDIVQYFASQDFKVDVLGKVVEVKSQEVEVLANIMERV